jgi:hypothetical protein
MQIRNRDVQARETKPMPERYPTRVGLFAMPQDSNHDQERSMKQTILRFDRHTVTDHSLVLISIDIARPAATRDDRLVGGLDISG